MTQEWEQAVRDGDLARVRQLAAGGADINALDHNGQTALMIAAQAGHAAVVVFLIRQGGWLDYTAKHGLTALMLAVIRGDLESVRMLVDGGADLTIRATGAPFSGRNALDLALAQGRFDLAGAIQKKSSSAT